MEWLVHSQTSAAQIWMTLTCWPGNVNGAWVESASYVTRIGQIGMEPWSRHCKNFKRSGHCNNFKRPAWLDLLTWKQCVTYRDLMSCVYALYQANRSNRHRTEYDLDLLTWKWCVMRHPSMGFICASYEVNRSNSHGADITKTSDNPCDFDHWPFDPEMVLMTCIWATYQSVKLAWRHRVDMAKTSNGPMWLAPLKWKWCVTHHDLMGCICTTYRWVSARKT